MEKTVLLFAIAMLLPSKLFAQTQEQKALYFEQLPAMDGVHPTEAAFTISNEDPEPDCSINPSISPDNGKYNDVMPSGHDSRVSNMYMRFQACSYQNHQIYRAVGWVASDGKVHGYQIQKNDKPLADTNQMQQEVATTEARPPALCQECQKKGPVETLVKDVVGTVKKVEKAVKNKFRSKPANHLINSLSKECQGNFMGADGSIGPWGEYWIQKMKALNFAQYPLYGSNDESHFCPRYNEMSEEEKYRAYLYAFMILANKESSCDPGAISPICIIDKNGYCKKLNPNGRGLGIYQMDGRQSVLLARAPACRKPMLYAKGQGNAKEYSRTYNKDEAAHNNINCAATIFENLLQNDNGILGYQGNYWGPLKGRVPAVMNDLKTYKPCFEDEQ